MSELMGISQIHSRYSDAMMVLMALVTTFMTTPILIAMKIRPSPG